MTAQYIIDNKDRFLDELLRFLEIPSVSANQDFEEDVFEAAEFVKERLIEAGADNVEVISTGGYPVVYGEKIISETAPTVIVYGHYDVQPADPYELWDNPPFEPLIKDGKIYARGACDDKGQMYMHIKAFEAMVQTNSLPCNVKFMIEGEEEVGSINLGDFIQQYKLLYEGDVILISDTSMLANDVPSITTGIRGLSYMEVEVTGPNRDLHSGVYGGAVANPINILCQMIASLHDEDRKITIPGFYDKVVNLSEDERKAMAEAPFNESEYKRALDVMVLDGEKGYTSTERTSIRPTLDVNGIWGGYTGEGAKTVLPSKAYAKISMRLVPHQTNEEISQLFEANFKAIAPSSVKVKVTALHGGNPVVTPSDSAAYRAAEKAYEETFLKKPIPVRSGGSIPIVALFKDTLGLDSVLMGFGLDSDAIHSPNEHFGIFNFYKGIDTIIAFYMHFAALSNAKK